jgi:DNA-binding NtrC family response regulator
VNARLLSATNADLRQEVASGRFREDLLFRLNTIEIALPPLRDRREDILQLATHFLSRHGNRYGKAISGFDYAATEALRNYSWPGNIRELNHVVERSVLMARGNTISVADLGLRSAEASPGRLEEMPLEDVEKCLIRKAVERYAGNVSQAAQALGLSRSALYRRLERYAIRISEE